MRLVADLHLHSRFSKGVSQDMTLENIALWAQRKGLDLLGTGDCLQPQWLDEIEAKTFETEPGLRQLKPEVEAAVQARLPAGLRRTLRFLLSTEVNCVAEGRKEMRGLHQLLYFPSVAVAREFARRVGSRGDLRAGRPDLAISAALLLRGTANFERTWQAPAHVMNPWFSALGVIGGETSLEKIYGAELPRLLAVETGLTSDPEMCRRVPGLDRFGLFSCSDAHSLENLGRECTLLDTEPSYDAIMAAVRAGTGQCLRGTLKTPLENTRYYRNWCSHCQKTFAARDCPRCGRRLTPGSHDHIEALDGIRPQPVWPDQSPPYESLLPLAAVVAGVEGRKPDGDAARRRSGEIIDRLEQPERYVLTEAEPRELLRAVDREVASAILHQRKGPISRCDFDSGLAPAGQQDFNW